MKKVFVEADALIALVYKKDANNQKAKKIYTKLKISKCEFYSSNTSLYEAVTVLSQRINHQVVIEFLIIIKQTLSIVFIDKKREQKGLEIFARQTSKNVSFFDCLNMAIMKELKIKEIFSFDKHYKKNGFLRIGVDNKL